MVDSETPENLVGSTTELIINVPVQDNERQNDEQRWIFQRYGYWAMETEHRASIYINNNKILLTLAYTSLFLVVIGRIILHSWIFKKYSNQFSTDNERIEIAEIALSCVWLIYFIITYIRKFRRIYTEDNCRDPVLFAFFCIQYFMIGSWAVNTFYGYAEIWEYFLAFVLFILYGFLAEKSPNTVAIVLYSIFMCFIVEALIRLVTCKWRNPCKSNNEQQYTTKRIPVVSFFNSQYEQNNCAICLMDFEEGERVCQLNCHPNHIFHFECMKEWLDRNHLCPYCRVSI